MNKNSVRSNIITLLILFIAVTSIMLAFGSGLFTSQNAASLSSLDSGYSISVHDNNYSSVLLSSFKFDKVKRGDVIRLYNTLPDQKLISPTIMFITYLSTVDVYVDGKLVYAFGHEYYSKGMMIPKKQHLITLDDKNKNKRLEIVIVAGEDGAFENLGPIYYDVRKDLVTSFLQNHRLVIFIGGFFIMYSCLLLSLGVYLLFIKKRALSLLSSAGVSMLFGVYIYAYEDVFCFISNNDYFFTALNILLCISFRFRSYSRSILSKIIRQASSLSLLKL